MTIQRPAISFPQPLSLAIRQARVSSHFGSSSQNGDDVLLNHAPPLNYTKALETCYADANKAELADIYEQWLKPEWKVLYHRENKNMNWQIIPSYSGVCRLNFTTMEGRKYQDVPDEEIENLYNLTPLSGLKALGLLGAAQAKKVAELESNKDHLALANQETDTQIALLRYRNNEAKKGLLPALWRALATLKPIQAVGLLAAYRPPEIQKPIEPELPWVTMDDVLEGCVVGRGRSDQQRILEALLSQLQLKKVVRTKKEFGTPTKYLLDKKGHLLFKQYEAEIEKALGIDPNHPS